MMNKNSDTRAPASGWHAVRQAGFTLLELMIVVAIIAILASIAYPQYTKYIVRTHRTAAEACLSEMSNYMERYYTTNLNYAKAGAVVNTLPALDCRVQTAQNYSYTLAHATTTTYVVTATPANAQSTRDSARCGALTMNQTGARTAAGNAGVAACW